MRLTRTLTTATLTALTATTLVATSATAAGAASQNGNDNRNNNTSEKLREAASAQGGLEHLRAFQAIADRNGGTRASGTEGYDQSVDYVVSRLRKAGYRPTVQAFDFPFFQELSPATLTAGGRSIETGSYTYSGSGDVTNGKITAVDLVLPPGEEANTSTSGCEDADFAGLDFSGDNDVALVQRGTCAFGDKALNAEEAGAEAVIIFNEGQEGRTDLIVGTLGAPLVTIPVVGASFADGVTLSKARTASVSTDTISEIRETYNVLAQTSGNTRNVVMAGAHLDSVIAGPGANDNGSGSAGILEVAEAMAKVKPTNAVRFAWWGAEELGLLGSEHYVADLQANRPAELDRIALYLNFDMIASPNFVRFVYDGDNSDAEGAPAGPKGSDVIEDMFTDYFGKVGLATEGTDFSGRSDYGPFIAEGVDIPAGGLFTGAEEIKTEEQEAIYGGVAGAAFDPCYHEFCDTLKKLSASALGERAATYAELRREYPLVGNVNMLAFEQNIDAIAHSVLSFSYTTQSVNGVKGSNPGGKTAVKGPGGGKHGTASTRGGGGLHDDHHEQPSS